MRVMTGDAGDPSLDVTRALTEPIGVVIDLEALLARASGLVDVDMEHVVAEGLPRPEGVVAAIETSHADHGYRGQEMTLKADGVAQCGRQPRRVDDGGPRLGVASAALHRLDVLRRRAVAALAARPLRKCNREHLRHPVSVTPLAHLGICVVAEEAFATNGTRDAVVVGPVVSRRHRPGALLRVPGDGELIQLAARRAVEVDPGTMARSDDPVDLLLDGIDAPAGVVHLVASKGQFPALPGHLVVTL